MGRISWRMSLRAAANHRHPFIVCGLLHHQAGMVKPGAALSKLREALAAQRIRQRAKRDVVRWISFQIAAHKGNIRQEASANDSVIWNVLQLPGRIRNNVSPLLRLLEQMAGSKQCFRLGFLLARAFTQQYPLFPVASGRLMAEDSCGTGGPQSLHRSARVLGPKNHGMNWAGDQTFSRGAGWSEGPERVQSPDPCYNSTPGRNSGAHFDRVSGLALSWRWRRVKELGWKLPLT